MIGCLHPAHSSALTATLSPVVVTAADAGDDVIGDVITSGAVAAGDATAVAFSVMSAGDFSAEHDNETTSSPPDFVFPFPFHSSKTFILDEAGKLR